MISKFRTLALLFFIILSGAAFAQPILFYVTNATDSTYENWSICRNNVGDSLAVDMVVWAIEDSLNNGMAPAGPDGLPTGDDRVRMFFRMGEGTTLPGMFYAGLTAFSPSEFTPGTFTAGKRMYLRAFMTTDTTLPPPPGTYYATSTLPGGVLPIVPSVFGSDVIGFTWPAQMTNQTAGILPTNFSPNGGENWAVGTQQNITWTAVGLTGNVTIEINRNYPLGTWTTIATVPATSGSYTWTVTGPATATARIRVTSVTYPTITRMSNGNFQISAPGIVISSPNGGETWVTGTNATISWVSQDVTGNVQIQLNRNYPSGTWETLFANTANDGSESWLVTAPTTTTARVRILSVLNPVIGDTSNANFTIAAPSITVTSPNGGEVWTINQSESFTWTSQFVQGNVRIDINRNYPSGTWTTIYSSIPNDGIEVWSPTGPPTTTARIRIVSVNDPNISDMSNNNFTIRAPTITVTSPNGGESWLVGTQQPITWSVDTTFHGNVHVQLNRAYPNGAWTTLFNNIPRDTSVIWTVTGPATAEARIRVVAVFDTTIFDVSNANFSITAPSITVTSPNGGEVWTINQTRAITWTSQFIQGNVRIELNRNYPSGTWSVLFNNTPNDGTENWTVTGPASATARIRIVAMNDTSYNDISNANFTIRVPTLTVTAPNGGETWGINTQQQITWSVDTAFVGNVHIQLNRNYPSGAWTTLFSNIPRDSSSVSWLVSGPATTTARVRVVAAFDTSISDISNANFTIASPTITVTSPNGGEVWTINQSRAITWTSQFIQGNVRIELNRNYPSGTWSVLFNNIANDGTENWTVTGPATTNARIRVVAVSDTNYNDISNANFTIRAPTITVTSPNGGEAWTVNSNRTISWTVDTAFVGNVNVQLNRDYPAGNWETLFSNVPSNQPVNWVVTGPTTQTARIRVLAAFDTTISDVSNANFAIVIPVISVVYPNGGDTLFAGSIYTLRWTREYVPGQVQVHLNRSYPNGEWVLLGTTTADTLVWEATVPQTWEARIRVRSVTDTTIMDVSNGNFAILVNSVALRENSIPKEFTLEKAYPNPFNTSTVLKVGVPKDANVTLAIYNLMGQKVATLHQGKLSAGYHSFTWNAPQISSGIYIVRMETAGWVRHSTIHYIR
ncbi:MAG: T9SS type A sorting domain-containing protein [bacterium]|nr:T9SS type A sorting domain-containing protein [bacterium]